MYLQGVKDEYMKALRQGQKEFKELSAAGRDPYPVVLDELLPNQSDLTVQELPAQDIPIERVVGSKSAGRVSAFTAGFLPLLDADSEFATKWMALCSAHLSDEGIRDPILCYEYLGDFYVQEGNKRLSVLKHFGAAKIPSQIRRLLPPPSQEPRIRAYYEFLDFYKDTKLYDLQFVRPGDYAKLLAALGREPGQAWNQWECRNFTSLYHYFKEAFAALGGRELGLRPEEALLLWLQVYPFRQLGEMSAKELKKSLAGLWEDVQAGAGQEPVKLHTDAPPQEGKGLLGKLITPAPEHLGVAFLYQQDAEQSTWTRGHEKGRQYLEQALGDKISVRCYFHADSPSQAEALLDQAVAEGRSWCSPPRPSCSGPR